jgi:hypothetical protein
VDFGNLDQKMGLTATGPDDPCPRTDGLVVRISAGLPPICAGGCGCPRYMSIDIP